MNSINYPYNLVLWLLCGSRIPEDLNGILEIMARVYIPDLLKMVDALEPDVKRYIELAFGEKMTSRQIMTALNIDYSGIKSLRSQAEYRLKRYYKWKAGSANNEWRLSGYVGCLEEENTKLKSLLKKSGTIDINIEEVGLSTRIVNCLKANTVKRLSDLEEYSEEDLRKMKYGRFHGLGPITIAEIKSVLSRYGLSLKY